MKHLQLIIIGTLILFSFKVSTAQEKKELENSMLWKITHKDFEKPSYIFGTMHIMCEKDFNIPRKVLNRLEDIEALVLEVNLSDPQEMAKMQESIKNTKKISEELSETKFKELEIFFKEKLKEPLMNYNNYGLSTLYSLMIFKMLSCQKMKSFEVELTQLAKKNQIKISGLEKISDQMQAFKNAYPSNYLVEQIFLFESYKKDFNNAIGAYQKEDLKTAVSLLTKEAYMNKNAIVYMLEKRNKNWVNKIPKMLKEKTLFAVGAAHLPGKYGVLNLLREKGYTITPVLN